MYKKGVLAMPFRMFFKMFLLPLAFVLPAFGLVDTINGNYSKTFVDFEIKGSAFPLKLERTYNSRSLYKGLFGMGWCSNLETRVDVLPDGTPQMTVCGGGLEVAYLAKNKSQNVSVQVDKIIAAVKKQNKNLSSSYFAKLKGKLMKSKVLRSEFLRAYQVRGAPVKGTLYMAEGRRNDTLEFNPKGHFKRILPSGSFQFFSLQSGRLIQVSDRTGNYVKFSWSGEKILSAVDNKGKKLVFQYDNNGRMKSIKGFGKKLADYKITKDKLEEAQNQDGLYQYEYDDLYNLTQITYPAGKGSKPKTEKLTYNEKKDWVTSFTNKKGCVEKYNYQTNPNDQNHFWADVRKQCGKVITNKSRYEFWNKKGPTGALYLHRARQDINGAVKDITYHPQFKRPLAVSQNNFSTKYAFYANGLLKQKTLPNQKMTFKNYHTRCRKPQQVVIENFAGKKMVGKQVMKIQYFDKSCLMEKASRSDGRWVHLQRDESGRIGLMKDQSGRAVEVAYDDFTDKPRVISQKGVGSITLDYDPSTGKSKGLKKGSDFLVAAQVLRVFNGFLEMIRPVAGEVSI